MGCGASVPSTPAGEFSKPGKADAYGHANGKASPKPVILNGKAVPVKIAKRPSLVRHRGTAAPRRDAHTTDCEQRIKSKRVSWHTCKITKNGFIVDRETVCRASV
jgi:hypothetical protein